MKYKNVDLDEIFDKEFKKNNGKINSDFIYNCMRAVVDADRKGRWINVKDELPDLEQPVWMIEKDRIIIGCLCNYDGGGVIWCLIDKLHYGEYFRKTKGYPWDFDIESDDEYRPTHWEPLPDLEDDI